MNAGTQAYVKRLKQNHPELDTLLHTNVMPAGYF